MIAFGRGATCIKDTVQERTKMPHAFAHRRTKTRAHVEQGAPETGEEREGAMDVVRGAQ